MYNVAAAEYTGAGGHTIGTVTGDDEALLVYLNALG